MRVLEAHLEAALNAGSEPYLQLQYCTSSAFTWLDAPYPMYSFTLGDLQFNVKSAGTALYNAYAIRLKRGGYWHNTAHYETSSHYYVNNIFQTEKEGVEIEATIFPRGNNYKYAEDGNLSYQVIIDAICAQFGYTAAYEDPTAAFWDNIFYPAGRALVLQSPHSFFTLLHQKLFVYAQDNNDGESYFRQWFDDQLVGTGGHPSLETLTTFQWKKEQSTQYRLLMWRDEAATIHFYPNPATYPNLPVFNLGYIESTATVPTAWQSWHLNQDKRTFHLKYQDGDVIHCSSGTYQIRVFETFNRKEAPSLYLQFKALLKFRTTEGGPLPSTLEASAPYTPINVSEFDNNLNSTHNNLQAFANAVDEMTCGPAIYAASEKATPDDADKFPLVDSTTSTHLVRWISYADLKNGVHPFIGARLFLYSVLGTTVSSVATLLHLTGESFDAGSIANVTTHEITIPEDGYYLVSGCVTYDNMPVNSTGVTMICVDSASLVAIYASNAAANALGSPVSDIFHFTAGQKLTLWYIHNAATTTDIAGDAVGSYTWLSVVLFKED